MNTTTRQRSLIALLSIFFAAGLLYLFLPRNAGLFRVIPSQSALVLEFDGLLRARKLMARTPDTLWQDVFQSKLLQQCFEDYERALTLFKHDPERLRAFAQKKTLAAFSLHPSDSLHACFALELESPVDLEKVFKINQLKPEYRLREFREHPVFTIICADSKELEIAVSGNFLLFSSKAAWLEASLAQLETTRSWWTERPYIEDLPKAAIRFHLHPAALAEQVRSKMNPRWRDLPDLLSKNLEWVGLSWNESGVNILAETTGFFSQFSHWGASTDQSVYKILPNNTAFVAKLGLGLVADFYKPSETDKSTDFDRFVLPWAGAEAAFAISEPLSPALSNDRIFLISVRDSVKAVASLRAYAKERGGLPGATGTYQMFEVFGFSDAAFLKPILGADEAFRNPVCALVDGYAVIAPNRSALEIFLDQYLVNQTLATNVDWLQLQQKHVENGYASILLNTAYLQGLLQNLLSFEGASSFSNIGYLNLDCMPGQGKRVRIQLTSQALSESLAATDLIWKSNLEAPVINQPFLVDLPAGKSVVLVQDTKFNLYCLDAQNGAIRWRKALSEPILSAIKGIDFYRTGTIAYTFSTEKKIYTLDAQGGDLQGFPFSLPAIASNPATLVEFDDKSNPSYFVACQNGKIYGFDAMRRPLSAWNGVSSSGVIRQPILHFQHQGMDFLAVLTENGMLSVFGRDGTLRFDPVNLAASDAGRLEGKFITPLQVDLGAKSPRIYTSNTLGQVFACDLLGNLAVQTVGKAGSNASFGQLKGDASFEWAVFDEKKLKLGGWDKGLYSTITKAQFPEQASNLFLLPEAKIGLVDTQFKRLWLLDHQGNPMPGFPLGGDTRFELRRMNQVEMLIVGNSNGVWAYRLR